MTLIQHHGQLLVTLAEHLRQRKQTDSLEAVSALMTQLHSQAPAQVFRTEVSFTVYIMQLLHTNKLLITSLPSVLAPRLQSRLEGGTLSEADVAAMVVSAGRSAGQSAGDRDLSFIGNGDPTLEMLACMNSKQQTREAWRSHAKSRHSDTMVCSIDA